MAKIETASLNFTSEVENTLNKCILAYYKIKILKKQISEQKKILAKHAPKLQIHSEEYELQFGSKKGQKVIAIMRKGGTTPETAEMSNLLFGANRSIDAAKKVKTCSRFIKHLKAGDLVKTVETQDNN